jgi:hypothetical protein
VVWSPFRCSGEMRKPSKKPGEAGGKLTLKMEGICSSESSGFIWTSRRYNPERCTRHKSCQLSTTPWRRMGEWMYRSTYSWPQH